MMDHALKCKMGNYETSRNITGGNPEGLGLGKGFLTPKAPSVKGKN